VITSLRVVVHALVGFELLAVVGLISIQLATHFAAGCWLACSLLENVLRLFAQLGELTQTRQVLERLQTEQLEESGCRAVQHRAPGFVFLSQYLDQLALEQTFDHLPRIDATDVVDFRAGRGLAISDDRESFELRATQPN